MKTQIVINKSPTDEEIAALQREATRHKQSKDWSKAVECLNRAHDLMVLSGLSYPADSWTRLPLFLQQAGNMEAANECFSCLISDVKRRISKEFGHASGNAQAAMLYQESASIYDKWSLAWSREKNKEMSANYGELSKQHRELAIPYRAKADAEREKELAKFRIAREARRQTLLR